MILSNKKGVQHFVATLAALGLQEVVLCPGSRNAPLVVSFHRHPAFVCSSIRDERSAAFFALGKAVERRQPVALVCTSGSAVLNFAPAIVEAYYQRIPLLVFTCDRSHQWIDQGDGQTMRQEEVYRNFIRASFSIDGDAHTETDLWFIERSTCEGYHRATLSDPGPVHINIHLDEPLYETEKVTDLKPKIIRRQMLEQQLPNSLKVELAQEFSSTKKVMILAGQQLPDDRLLKQLSDLAEFENVVVLTEAVSNLPSHRFVEQIDRAITGFSAAEAETMMPELLVTLGGAVVSKRIKQLLRTYRPAQHWNIHPFDSETDTYQSLTRSIPMAATDFFEQLAEGLHTCASGYGERWRRLNSQKAKAQAAFATQCGYSDFQIFQKFFEQLPSGYSLHIGNSSPIRYSQLFDYGKAEEIWSNRGTSGIDGSTSTAVGAAAASPQKQFILITGDISFHYDINALWNEAEVENLKIMVVNNGGGGIFRIIEGPNQIEERSRFVETAMKTNAEQLAAHYHWHYLSAHDEESFDRALQSFFERESKRLILEVFTDSDENPIVLKEYWKRLKTNL